MKEGEKNHKNIEMKEERNEDEEEDEKEKRKRKREILEERKKL